MASRELVSHCIEKLQSLPKVLTIHQPLSSSTKTSLIRNWSRARFDAQQRSIITLHPDHPDYGRGLLISYDLEWTEDPKDPSMWNLRIFYNPDPGYSPREVILLASAIGGTFQVPFNKGIFDRTKTRMLQRDPHRRSGTVLPALRPAVANVLWSQKEGQNYIRAWNMDIDITTTGHQSDLPRGG